MTVRNPQRSRQSFYRITDPYLRFWFRFVLPAQGRLTDADGARRHLEGHVLPRLDEFVASPAFEEVCQEWLRGELDAGAVGGTIGHIIGHTSRYYGHTMQLAQIASEVGVHERTLRRAVSEGALRAHRPSPRTLEISVGESTYARRRWPLLAKLRGALRTERNVRFALLFGSAARGEDSERSDVDVIASLRDPSFSRLLDLRLKLEQAVGRSVDVVLLEDAEEDPTFLAMALVDGRVLVDREGAWAGLRRRKAELRRRGARLDLARRKEALARADRFLVARE